MKPDFGRGMMMLLVDDSRFRPAMELVENAQFAEAIEQLNALQDHLSPEERVVALYWKASCLTWLRDLKQARTQLAEALTQVGTNDCLRMCLELQSAILLGSEEGPDRAVPEIRSWLKQYAEQFKAPDLLWTYACAKTYLGSYLSRCGHYSEAIAELEEALSLESRPLTRHSIHIWLADAYYHLSDLDKAKSHFEGALIEAESMPVARVSPDYIARPRYELALIAYKQRRFGEAKRHLRLLSEVSIQDPKLTVVVNQLKFLLDQSLPS
jgi:tetratricopeptide (TPR) repeat protein